MQVQRQRDNHTPSASERWKRIGGSTVVPALPSSNHCPFLPITNAASILSKLFCMTFATVALIITITQAL